MIKTFRKIISEQPIAYKSIDSEEAVESYCKYLKEWDKAYSSTDKPPKTLYEWVSTEI